MAKESQKPLLSSILSNWKSSKASFFQKVKMAARNNFIKIRSGQSCCGQYGEVGC